MSQYNTLKQAIQDVIRTNGNNEITGASLQQSLLSMINSLGAGYQFMGVATPATNPGTPDQKVFYITASGTYMGFVVKENNLGILYYDTEWHMSQIGANTGVYKNVPSDVSTAIYAILDLSIKNKQHGYYYWLQINKTNSIQQLAFFRTDAAHISGYTEFVSFFWKDTAPFDSGIQLYTGVLSSGEAITILVNWDGVSGYNSLNADKYEFQDWVFTGGKQSAYLPITENNIANNAVTNDKIADDSITESKIANLELLPYMDYGVYKCAQKGSANVILSILDLSIKNKQHGYYYWLQINKTDSFQQLAFFRTDAAHISGYTGFKNLVEKYTAPFDSGTQLYTGVLSSGEAITILVNWDKISGYNSMNADKYEFQDWVFTGGKQSAFLPFSLSIDEMPFDAAGIAKLIQKTDGVANNLVSFQDFHAPDGLWVSGSIEKIQNFLNSNRVEFNSVGAEASWTGYITAFIKLTDLEERSGLDFRNTTQFLDISFNNGDKDSWVILRYEEDNNYAFYLGGDIDAIFNKNGSQQGFNAGDTTTWDGASFSIDEWGVYHIDNLKIPYTYKGKNLYAVMICVGGVDGEKTIDNLTCVVHGGNYVSIPFFYDKYNDTIKGLDRRIEQIENGVEQPTEKYYAACGDSITNANHPTIYDIDENDPYTPIDGYSGVSTYKRKCYAYYIAKKFRLKWANYGWGGTTLHHCAPKGYAGQQDFNPFVDSRIENLKQGVNWDFISIFFGWNDCAFGPIYQRDLWLQETYGTNIGYPVNQSQIGASGFANAEQKAACDAATGSVGGIQYDNTDEYFFARFVGTINDNTKNTWLGAWNYALEYLMKKYPTAKIMIVAPYVSQYRLKIRNSVKQIAEKWGVVCFDFEDLPYWYYQTEVNTTHLANPDSVDERWYTINGTPCEPYVSGYNQARYSYDTLHPSNLGYETMANPFGDKLING